MAELFVRRTTGCLLVLVVALSCACVGLLVYSLADRSSPDGDAADKTTTSKPVKFKEKPKTEPWELEYRIPTTTIPHHYDLYLHPDLEAGTFTGKVHILVEVTSMMTFLVTHTKNLDITRTEVVSLMNDEAVELAENFEYEPNEFWVMRPRVALKPGNYSVRLSFSGSLEGKIVGFYKSVYTTAAGEKRSIATSKFQPTDARAAFPCFDEPSFKSSFSVTLVRPSDGYLALSNMPELSQKANSPLRGLTEVTFKKSVPMVTYLVCFIVCDFEYVETMTQKDKPFRVYATPDQVNRTHYARDIGVSILNFFEQYFEVEYPLPKQDMIAIPDFVSGAMEHWGLITYRETNLLYDPEGSASYNQQRVASVVSHELAHMWFGNLMTLSWWNDLWLNEGFASYIEYKGVDQYHPEWDMMGQFVVDDLQRVMRLDAQVSSHPIVQPVAHPDQITEIFDAISYSKGASVLRMLDDFMGEEEFRMGVRDFLKEHAFSSAVTNDLWHQLSRHTHLNVSAVMDTWTRQMGYPVLSVRRVSPTQLEVTQQRFLQRAQEEGTPKMVTEEKAMPEMGTEEKGMEEMVLGEEVKAEKEESDSPYGYKWHIPVTYSSSHHKERQLSWLYKEMPSLYLEVNANFKWVKLNVQQRGYYRVNYDDDMWTKLVNLLTHRHEVLSPPDRSSLFDDAFSLASADQVPYSLPLRLCAYLPKERHYIPWRTAAHHLSELARLLRPTKAYPLFREFVLQLVENHTQRLSWEDNGGHLERRLRPVLLDLACKSGSEACLTTAEARLKDWLRDPTVSIAPNLRSVVYKYGMQNAGYEDWLTMLDRYTSEINAQEKTKLMTGLTSINTRWIIHRYLDVTKNESVVRSQDYLSGLRMLALNPAATDIVWGFVKEEWDYLVGRFSLNSRYLGTTVKSIVSLFSSRHQLQDAEDFFRARPDAGAGRRARQQALEEVRHTLAWLTRSVPQLYDALMQL